MLTGKRAHADGNGTEAGLFHKVMQTNCKQLHPNCL
jgi:hypothetical protein